MNYKAFYCETPQLTFFNNESITSDTSECSVDDFEIDPEIFIFIEKGLSQSNSPEIINILDDFEIASKVLSHQYIQTFGQTKVPSQLIELLNSSNKTISYYAARIICSLITPNTPEYAEDLCNNNFMFHCANILNKKSNDPSLIYIILVALSNLATFSKAVCDSILSYISVDILAYYAQSKILDDSSYEELLRLLVILSYNFNDNINDIITIQLIELTQSIFSDLIKGSEIKRYRILQLASMFSKFPQFYDFFFYDSSSRALIEILKSRKGSRKELYFLIPILTNIIFFLDGNFQEELYEICELISMISENEFVLDEDLRIVKLSCRFIQVYIRKYSDIDEDISSKIIDMLINIVDKYGLKEKREIIFCVLDLLMHISEDMLFKLIFQDSLFGIMLDVLELGDDKIANLSLQTLISLFHKYERTDHLQEIKKEFINEDGISFLVELMTTTDDEDKKQISEMAEMLFCKYFQNE